MPSEMLPIQAPRPDVLIIENHGFPCRRKATGSDKAICKEEDLHFAAKDTLEDLRKGPIPPHFVVNHGIDCWQAWLMFLLGPVAKHYEVDKEELWQLYSKHYGPGLVLEFMEEDRKKQNTNKK